MPASGPVYQPTTVSYEQQSEWTGQQESFMCEGGQHGLRNPKCLRWLILSGGASCIAIGLILIAQGCIHLIEDSGEIPVDHGSTPAEVPTSSPVSGLAYTTLGTIFTVAGVLLVGFYVRLIRKCVGCPCFPSKDQRLARQLDQSSNGQILTLNPSTDLLVTAQYGPVSEIAYQPQTVSEQEEMSKLMASDNKESNEENERMLEPDPRIVLRPLSHNEEA